MSKLRVFTFTFSASGGFGPAVALTEDGRVLARKIVENEQHLPGRFDPRYRPELREIFDGLGCEWEFVVVKGAEVAKHPDVQKAIRLAKERPDYEPPKLNYVSPKP